MITILGAAFGPLPFGWAASHGHVAVLATGAALCAMAAMVNLVVAAPRAAAVGS